MNTSNICMKALQKKQKYELGLRAKEQLLTVPFFKQFVIYEISFDINGFKKIFTHSKKLIFCSYLVTYHLKLKACPLCFVLTQAFDIEFILEL